MPSVNGPGVTLGSEPPPVKVEFLGALFQEVMSFPTFARRRPGNARKFLLQELKSAPDRQFITICLTDSLFILSSYV